MNDILSGAAILEEAEAMLRQLTKICKAGGFSLKKWSVLSLTAKLFDPLGWLSPITVLAKIFIQSTWLLGLDWDSPLPNDEARKWLRFQSELPELEKLFIPCWLGSVTDLHLEIHEFANASVRAYSAVIYLKTKTYEITRVTLLAAKTKVAPLKQVSLPRLELSAATLLAQLVAHAVPLISAEKALLHLWSDSTVTLGWIRGHPSSWITYVANWVRGRTEDAAVLFFSATITSDYLVVPSLVADPPSASPRTGQAESDQLNRARLSWLRLIQAAKYEEEIEVLQGEKPLPLRSFLLQLSPFLDEEGILRFGGRLRHARMPFDAAHLPYCQEHQRIPTLSSPTTIISGATLHGGTQLTLCSLR
ncbi:uncharacterized protein LOC114933370 [Nylanderia fulva]|uniref:uncharacterized protein LOC114933370 n=1 Tax=Nylanderia fulva TaxID=613905 RepID=UPI0010FB260A|nr:uncharacterized protein LOC114933370 [Nylanderia fulva]